MESFYKVTEFKKNIYRIFSPAGVYMDLFVGSKKALLLDTGYGFGNLKEVVKNITSLPLIIVNTHGHIDHACGNYQFDEPIYIHPLDFDVCKEQHGLYRKKLAVNYARTCLETDILPPYFNEEEYYKQSVGNLVPIEEGHIFDLGGITLEVIHVPGHTKGSIGLLYHEESIFYSGDSMNFSTWLFLPEACTVSTYIESIKKMQNIDFTWIMFSHADVPFKKEVINDFLDLAENIDYENGYPFSAPLVPEANAKFCVRKGYEPDDMFKKEGYAAIVVGIDKLR